MSSIVHVLNNQCLSKDHIYPFMMSFDGDSQVFTCIEQAHAFVRYRTPANGPVHEKSIRENLAGIMENKTGQGVRNYLKSIQPTYREKNTRGSSGHPDWFTVARNGHLQNQYLFLFDVTLAKFQQDSSSREVLLNTGDEEIYDETGFDSSLNYGKILMAVRAKLRSCTNNANDDV